VIRAADDLAVLYTDWTITATEIPLSGELTALHASSLSSFAAINRCRGLRELAE
jgi:hypothetical protein